MRPVIFAVLLCFVAGTAAAQDCANGQCSMPLRDSVKATAQVATLPVRVLAEVQPVRSAALIAMKPVAYVQARKPVRSTARRTVRLAARILGCR
jgi:hypothetical protein